MTLRGQATQNQLSFTAVVSDGRGLEARARVAVSLKCAGPQNRPPRFAQITYKFTATQCTAGTVVGTVSAIDPDGDQITSVG